MTDSNSSSALQSAPSSVTDDSDRDRSVRLQERKYHRIQSAASKLGCTVDDLVHLGANGGLEILAPVVQAGSYQWPGSLEGFYEIEEPFICHFDATDRVFLSRKDIAHLEAMGWVTPTSFYAPTEALNAIDKNYRSAEDASEIYEQESSRSATILDKYAAVLQQAAIQHEEHGYSPEETREAIEAFKQRLTQPVDSYDADMDSLREMALFVAWHFTGSITEHDKKTTIDHLFISDEELLRLLAGRGGPTRNVRDDRGSNGHVERHAAKREQILMAAIYCQKQWPESCSNGTNWAATIDEKSALFWESEPPLSRARVEELLRNAVRFAEIQGKKLVAGK